MAGPLVGIRIIDCTAFIAGPLATMMLGDQGADVIKVEPPGLGDVMRYLGTGRGGIAAGFANCNRSKRAMVINLKDDAGRELLIELISSADVFVQNWRPGVTERLGIAEPILRRQNPRLIYVSSSAFGFDGPWSQKPAFDHVIQAASGIADLQTDPEIGDPTFVRNTICDNVSAYTLAQAITAALLARERTGEGQHVKLSMLDAATAFMWPVGMMQHTILGDDVNLLPPITATYRMGKTADGFIAVAAATPDQQDRLLRLAGGEELLADPRFVDMAARLQNLEAMLEVLRVAFEGRTTAELMQDLEAADIPCSPITSLDELHEHPQVVANQILEEVEHPLMGRLRQPRPPAVFDRTPLGTPGERTLAPALGQHTDELLAELGRSPDQIADLRARAVVA
jgi:crotonobetainyl-CoA:carnitine CoA-transferase CaiB-like acyl-CoA transferase